MTGQIGRSGWIDTITRRSRIGEAGGDVSERSDQFEMLQRMTAKLRSSAPLTELLNDLASTVCDALGADIALVRVLDPEQERMSVQGSHGVPPHLLGRILGERTRTTPAFRSLRPGTLISYTDDRPLVLQHADLVETSEVQALMDLGAAHLLILPLHQRGELVGRLDLLRRQGTLFNAAEGQQAVALATLVAAAAAGPSQQDAGERYDRIIEASFVFQQSIVPLANVGEMLQSIVEAATDVIP